MAADSPRRTSRFNCASVRPQAYSDKSVVESVVDLIADVVPQVQAYSGTQKTDDKDKILWVKFERCDVNDLSHNPNFHVNEAGGPPLLLIIGYSNGVQIWHVTCNGEAQEVMSLRQGPVRILRVLPTPEPVFADIDSYGGKRPLFAMCDSSSAGQPFCSVKLVSLRSGDEVHHISFKTLPVLNIESNKRFLVVVCQEKLAVYETCQFRELFWVSGCYPCPGPNVNPVALGTRWLAYADRRLVSMHQSCGGMSGDGAQSYAATVISAAKGAFKGLTMFGEAMMSSVTGNKSSPSTKKGETSSQVDNNYRPGIVSVIDMQTVTGSHFHVNDDQDCDGLIAHFHAHANEPVAAMGFDQSGTLLLTACKLGHNFHIFRLMAHPCSSSLGAVHHLYTLHRGDTTAKVIDITFTLDTRWVAVTTHRGTTHVFPITPYGGAVSMRTHCSPRVVNRMSRFHKSAGLDEIDHASPGRRSPVLSGSPGSSGIPDHYPTLIRHNALNNNMGNPRLPPYPHPTTIYPLAQLKQQLSLPGIGPGVGTGVRQQSPTHATSSDSIFSVAAFFAVPRISSIGTQNLTVERREGTKKPAESLFIMGQHGSLIEYSLEPRARPGGDRVADDSPLDLGVAGRLQWLLQRTKTSTEVKPQQPSNPLVVASEAVVSQQPTLFPDMSEMDPVSRHDSRDSLSSDHSIKDDLDEQWLSQVEIITHVGPHRRLWMGPQFSFKTYQNTTTLSSTSSALLSHSPETQAHVSGMDIAADECDLESLKIHQARSSPVAISTTRPAYRRSSTTDYSPSPGRTHTHTAGALLIEAGSFDQSPNLSDVLCGWAESNLVRQPRSSEEEEDRLRETLADAMVESPVKDCGPTSMREDVFHGSNETLSTSSGSSGCPLPPRGLTETGLDMFPGGGSGSPDLLG
ncbi:BCAS3 microtubule associated cell migration factor-like [Haliotis rufescens]|uniref:BCAS3 microtubule associated cell migration factor-like n=1 Tax=Haliotis rufescens TaxID=6454 RepID=UPI001EB046F3|nr:BCAS3 microtubule associated cell migration factor-like [Haliotis rufescens]